MKLTCWFPTTVLECLREPINRHKFQEIGWFLRGFFLVGKFDDETQTSVVKERVTARGDPGPELLSLVRTNQTSAPTVSMSDGDTASGSHRWVQM